MVELYTLDRLKRKHWPDGRLGYGDLESFPEGDRCIYVTPTSRAHCTSWAECLIARSDSIVAHRSSFQARNMVDYPNTRICRQVEN
ncbi:hypothetical protein M378DRAFT_156660 [Amanita muscaria Koide BX008]|uniref:Uncharacterized protein n=1 Tax=Amanita muscaria (strain Koide BX008) TaxID=946122 RepID=A0A0C2T3T1_AMAMK|nr:hypothetical protein M378DRAFT_156660 [Amanita muscaria Koide BX008]